MLIGLKEWESKKENVWTIKQNMSQNECKVEWVSTAMIDMGDKMVIEIEWTAHYLSPCTAR